MAKPNNAFEFGPFRLEGRERLLTREGHPVPLRGRVFDTLYALVSRHGCLVTKDELMAEIWPDSVVEETNLNHNICILRRALGEKTTGQKYVETVPRQGYRFVGKVKELNNADEQFPAGTQMIGAADVHLGKTLPIDVSPPLDSDLPKVLRHGIRLWTFAANRFAHPSRSVITLLAVSALFVAVYFGIKQIDLGRVSPDSRPMLAVLPFENLTGDSSQKYIVDGFSHEIVAQLGRWNPARLRVIAHTSTIAYRETEKSISEIGGELGVNYLVGGSLRRHRNHYRISVLLIRVDNQACVWAANYSRAVGDATAVQIEIASAVVTQIGKSIAAEADEKDLAAAPQGMDNLSLCSREPAQFPGPTNSSSPIARAPMAE